LKENIAHELIHLAFPKLAHGDSFEDYYIKSLLRGHMVFGGRGIITEVTKPTALSVDSERKEALQRESDSQQELWEDYEA
jgi:hypothetical protein